ncbi:MAG TPA: PIG-L family deacetylase [Chloroflexota bacterium]|nr:PIG-L family deacetylase [Chloroflexota bacterium]
MKELDLTSLKSVLAVCAHPDDESFGLGAVVSRLVASGTRVSLLCFTRGEASTMGRPAGLSYARTDELSAAAATLGLASVYQLDHPDGRLHRVALRELVDPVLATARDVRADGLLVFDPRGVTGHDDHRRATAAALAASTEANLPVLAWIIPAHVAAALNHRFGTTFNGYSGESATWVLEVDRSRQLLAIDQHRSQSADNPVLRYRLELMGNIEWLMWLPKDTTA